MVVGIFINGFSSILTGLNFIVTIHKMRAPGMTWFRLPLFIWAHYATALIMVLGTPVIAITLVMVGAERLLHLGHLRPEAGRRPGALPAPVLVLLAPGGLHHDPAGDGRDVASWWRPSRASAIFGYEVVAFSSLAIAVVGFLVWGHHMFVSSQSVYAAMAFSLLSFLVAIPSAIKVFNWTATLYKGSISFEAPMIYVFGFIGLFLIGGLTGLFLAALAVDVHVTDTYFVVAHFHYIMVGGTIMMYLGGLHFWWPKIFGKLYHEGMARVSAVVIFVGFNLTFFPQFIVGYLGHAAPLPRVSAGVPALERPVDRRRGRPGHRLRDADVLPALLAGEGQAGARQPVGREGAGVGDLVAAADPQFRRPRRWSTEPAYNYAK